MKKLHLTLSLAAGLLGGLLSHSLTSTVAHAQTEPPPPKELRAQSFALVDDKGHVFATISIDQPQGRSGHIKLFDANGREIWSAGAARFRPLSER